MVWSGSIGGSGVVRQGVVAKGWRSSPGSGGERVAEFARVRQRSGRGLGER